MLVTAVLTFVHIVLCVFLILVVLLQTGKRADLAGAFGGGGSQTAFGARGAATVLSKATSVIAILFMLTSLGLAILSSTGGGETGSALDDLPEAAATAPAVPESGDTGAPAGDLPAPADGTETPAPAGDGDSAGQDS